MWNISNSRDDIRGKKGKLKRGESVGERIHERLSTPGKNLRVLEGSG